MLRTLNIMHNILHYFFDLYKKDLPLAHQTKKKLSYEKFEQWIDLHIDIFVAS